MNKQLLVERAERVVLQLANARDFVAGSIGHQLENLNDMIAAFREASTLEHALVDLFHTVRERITAELGGVLNVSELEHALAERVKAFAANPAQLDAMVAELLGAVQREQAELPQRAKEETPPAPVEPNMPPVDAPAPDAPAAPGPDLAAMAASRSSGAPLTPEKPEENAAAVSASGAAPSGE